MGNCSLTYRSAIFKFKCNKFNKINLNQTNKKKAELKTTVTTTGIVIKVCVSRPEFRTGSPQLLRPGDPRGEAV